MYLNTSSESAIAFPRSADYSSHGLVHEPFLFPVGPVNDKGRYR